MTVEPVVSVAWSLSARRLAQEVHLHMLVRATSTFPSQRPVVNPARVCGHSGRVAAGRPSNHEWRPIFPGADRVGTGCRWPSRGCSRSEPERSLDEVRRWPIPGTAARSSTTATGNRTTSGAASSGERDPVYPRATHHPRGLRSRSRPTTRPNRTARRRAQRRTTSSSTARAARAIPSRGAWRLDPHRETVPSFLNCELTSKGAAGTSDPQRSSCDEHLPTRGVRSEVEVPVTVVPRCTGRRSSAGIPGAGCGLHGQRSPGTGSKGLRRGPWSPRRGTAWIPTVPWTTLQLCGAACGGAAAKLRSASASRRRCHPQRSVVLPRHVQPPRYAHDCGAAERFALVAGGFVRRGIPAGGHLPPSGVAARG